MDEPARRVLAARAQVEAREHCGLERMLDRMERIYLDEMARRRGRSAGRTVDPGKAVRR